MTCRKCKDDKAENLFPFRSKGKGIRHLLCQACRSKYWKRYYAKNKKRLMAVSKIGARRRKKLLVEEIQELKKKPCIDCGHKFHYVCMDFDHRDGKKKSFMISRASSRGFSRAGILKEISKCDLVCANCHRLRTFKRLVQVVRA